MAAPRVFISYSHDSPEHKGWVLKLATDLRAAGIDAVLDQWDLAPGQDTVAFMADGITGSARVLLICTEEYVTKAEAGVGGVGYERLIVTAELVEKIDTKKFLPVVRGNAPSRKVPVFLGPRLYVDLSNDAQYSAGLEQIVREIHGTPSLVKPALGTNPFGGAAPHVSSPARVAGPSGITPAGQVVLDEDWFTKHRGTATKGLSGLGMNGAMELRFALHDPINKSQIELVNAVRKSEIRTFGWPIGVLVENRDEFRPRPVADGIVAEIAISKGLMTARSSYDFWVLRSNGDFYLLQSFFEDQRTEQQVFFDSRVVRVTESFMFCANLYENLGVSATAPLSVRVSHSGLAGRTLTTAATNRHIMPAKTTEDVSETEVRTSVAAIRERLADHVAQVVEPMFMLFDFKRFDRSVLDGIINNFVSGKV
jgi:hypothetical protein